MLRMAKLLLVSTKNSAKKSSLSKKSRPAHPTQLLPTDASIIEETKESMLCMIETKFNEALAEPEDKDTQIEQGTKDKTRPKK